MQQDRQVALSVLTTGCFPGSSFPGEKFRDHFIVRFVGAMNRNRTGTSQLTRCECFRYTTKAPTGSVRGVKGAERKMTAPKCRHFHCKVYLVSQIASRHRKEYRTEHSGTFWYRKIKNDGTEVPSFLTARISGFNQRASSQKRVPKTYRSENP